MVAVPLLSPLQVTLVELALPVRRLGWVIVTLALAVQPLVSVTVTLKFPGAKFVIEAVVVPEFQR